jgi:hypothetical protein
MAHLDIAQVTVRRCAVTRALATDAYDELGCAGIRFPSRLDGLPCYAHMGGTHRSHMGEIGLSQIGGTPQDCGSGVASATKPAFERA